MLIKKGNYSIIEEEEDQNPIKEIPQFDGDNKPGDGTYRDPTKGEDITTKAKEVKTDAPSKIVSNSGKTPDWNSLSGRSLSRNLGTLSDAAKKIIRDLKTKESVVDWKRELKKFFDNTFKSYEWILPNKRFLAAGKMLYGRKEIGDNTLKTIVAAVDTSSSISQAQVKLFVNEIMYLTKEYSGDQTIIIYCSDDIDNIDIVKKGGSPDFTKIKSTGGNAKGFIPPFQWVEKYKIKPSIFIYLTDTGGEMPDGDKYGIKKYINKVIWFICSTELYNKPPFGKILMAPPAAIK